jgi:hypothetical protein
LRINASDRAAIETLTASIADSSKQPNPDELLSRAVKKLHDEVAPIQVDRVQVGRAIDVVDLPDLLHLVVGSIYQYESILEHLPADGLRKRGLLRRNCVRAADGLNLLSPRCGLLLVEPVPIGIVAKELAGRWPGVFFEILWLLFGRVVDQLKNAGEVGRRGRTRLRLGVCALIDPDQGQKYH